MDKINFKNLPDKTTSITAEKLNKIQENVEKAINEKSSLPVGGDEGQILAKASNQDNDVEWIDNIGQGGGDTLPIGAILPFSGDVIPNGWLLCDGSPFSASEYPELFDLIGVTYGWDENRNPLLPDMRGRVVVGKKAATSANDTEFNALGKTGGEKAHTLTKSELPQIDIQTNYASSSGGDGSGLVYGTKTGSSNNSLIKNVNYGGEAHNNLQPYIVTNFIIKAKMTIVTNGEVIQQNGTSSTDNVYSAAAVDYKIQKLKEIILYENNIGTKETVTLSETTENFSYIEVFAKYGTAYYTSVKIFTPNDKYFNMTASMMNQVASTGYVASTNYSISGTTITPQYYGEWNLSSSSFSGDNKFTIFKVIGYR